MNIKKKHIKIFFLIVSLLIVLISHQTQQKKPTTSKAQIPTIPYIKITPKWEDAQLVNVARVVDGDTIQVVASGSTELKTVRYIGIDTPETVHPQKKVQCFGREASAKNKELIEGKDVYILKDISEVDKYGRLLRYVYLKDPESTQSGLFINEYLVKEGYAYSSTFPPDIAYQQLFIESQREASELKKGLWSVCPNK